MRVGKHDKPVTLFRGPQESNDSDGYEEALTPSSWWASIEPLSPQGDGRTVTSLLTMRWHPQVTMDTFVKYDDPVLGRVRQFFVRSFQNVAEANVELRCYCEEVVP